MAVTPLKETINVYNRLQQCSRVEQLRDPAVVTDYAVNKGDFINKDLLNVYSEAEGVVGREGLSVGVSGNNVFINAGYGVYRNFIFYVNSLTNYDASVMPISTTWYLILKVVEKRFTSGATDGGTETTDNALEGTPGTNPYGSLWPRVQSGYDPDNCLQISINNTSFDISNEWRYKYEIQLVSSIPANENPVAGTSINRFYINIGTVTKNSSGVLSIIDQIFTNSIAYRNKPNYFLNANQMAPSKMTIIQKTQNIVGFGNVTNFVLNPSGQSDTYILDLDDAASLNGYNPNLNQDSVIPGIDIINSLPYNGNGHRFKLIIVSNDPTKRLKFLTLSPMVSFAYPLSYQIPASDALGRIILFPGSVTSFSIYNNTFYIEDATNHITRQLYGDTDYSNIIFYPKYTTHKVALDILANNFLGSTPTVGTLQNVVYQLNTSSIDDNQYSSFKIGKIKIVTFYLSITYARSGGAGQFSFDNIDGDLPIYPNSTINGNYQLCRFVATDDDGKVLEASLQKASTTKMGITFFPAAGLGSGVTVVRCKFQAVYKIQ